VQLDFERDARLGEAANEHGRVRGQAVFDLVILAFGFGIEVAETGVPSISYWSEAGVPVAEFEGREFIVRDCGAVMALCKLGTSSFKNHRRSRIS